MLRHSNHVTYNIHRFCCQGSYSLIRKISYIHNYDIREYVIGSSREVLFFKTFFDHKWQHHHESNSNSLKSENGRLLTHSWEAQGHAVFGHGLIQKLEDVISTSEVSLSLSLSSAFLFVERILKQARPEW